MSLDVLATIAAALVVVLGALIALARWVRPKVQSITADVAQARDALLGRDAVVDSITGRELAPPLPGMGVRMAHQEQQTELLIVTVTKLVDQQAHQQRLERVVEDHDKRISALETAGVERIVARAESAQAWSAMEAAIHADPNEADLPDADVIDVDPE